MRKLCMTGSKSMDEARIDQFDRKIMALLQS
ncbi:MAG: Lrp/AsnC family transcriptional regulator, partial [Mesorhizobium sp.]